MEAVVQYFLKSAALISAFLLAYHFLLRRETFFKSNRWYLLSGLVTSLVLPLVTFKKVVWVSQQFRWTNVPVSAATVPGNPHSLPFVVDWYLVVAVIYAIGGIVMLSRLALDFYSLQKLLRGKIIRQQADYKFVDVAENIVPFSYLGYIVYNSSLYTEVEMVNIIEHEKVHSDQNHTFDVVLARFFCIAFWWNPMIWLYKKAILQNLEFIADSEATKNIIDKKNYQFTLLKMTTHENYVPLTNHFYQSLIKNRIIMLNKNQSGKWNSCKYLLIIPVLVIFCVCFQVKVVAQQKPNTIVSPSPATGDAEFVIDKNTSDTELMEHSLRLKENGIELKFSKVKRNGKSEIISLKTEFTDKNRKAVVDQSGKGPITPLRFLKDENGAVTVLQTNEVMHVSVKGNNNPEPRQTPDNNSQKHAKTVGVISPLSEHIEVAPLSEEELASQRADMEQQLAQMLYVVDGKEMSQADFAQIKPDNWDAIVMLGKIKTTDSEKDKQLKQKALDKYGEKAKYGVMIITTRKDNEEIKKS